MPDTPVFRVQQAFEQLTRVALAKTSLDAVMAAVAELAGAVVPGVDEVSVTFLPEQRGSSRGTTVACTGELSVALDETQYAADEGPCLHSARTGELVLLPDTATATDWTTFAAAAAAAGARSTLSVPVPVPDGAAAALNLYSLQAGTIEGASVALASTFAAYAGVALANIHLHETQARFTAQLQAALESRAVIDQAKGILMAERRIDADAAFAILVDLSQHSNRKLREVAVALVEQAVSG